MKIGMKLSISYAVLLVVMVVIVGFSLNGLSSLNDEVHLLAQDRFPKTVWANNIIDQVNTGARAIRNAFLSADPAVQKEQIDRTLATTPEIKKNIDSLTATIKSPEGLKLMEELNKNRNEFIEYRKQLLELFNSGQKEAAIEYLFAEFRDVQNAYMKSINDLIAYQTSLVNKAAEEAEAAYNSIFMLLIIISIIALVITVLLAIIITRGITKPLNQAVNAAEGLSKGNMKVDLDSNSKDETGILLNSMKTMAGSINKLVNEMNRVAGAAVEGKLDNRGNDREFQGEYQNIVRGFNSTLDAVIGPLNVTAEYVDRISKGDIPPRITDEYKGDFNEIKNNLNTCIDAINLLVTDAKMLSKAAEEGKLDTRANAARHGGDFRAIVDGVNKTLDNVIGPLNVAAEYVDRISKGDIPPVITDEYKGDFNEIKNNLNQCINAIDLLVADAKMLAKAAVEGKLDTRANATRHGGDFRAIVEGVNSTLDNVIGPLNVAAEYVDRIAKGDIPPKITDNYNGDFNEIKNNLNQCIDAVNLLVTDAKMLAKAAVEGKLDTRANANRHQGEFRAIVQGVNDTLDSVIGPLNVAAEYVDRIAKGDIPPKITDNYNGDFNEIKNNLNQCIDSLNGLIAEMNNMSKQHDLGDIDIVINTNKFTGAYRDMAEGVNNMVNGHIAVKKKAMACFMEFGNGNLDATIEKLPGKKAFINETIEKVRGNIKELVKDAVMLSIAAEEGRLATRADATKHQGDFKKIVDGVNKTLDLVIEPINEAGEVLSVMATGDLTVRMMGDYHGDLSKLKDDINALADSLSSLINQVNEVVQTSASSAMEISATAEGLAAATQEQSAQADEVASAVEEMSRTITENAMSANKTAEVAQHNGTMATEGGSVVSQTVTKMRDIANVVKNSAENIEKLGESSKQIGEIISVIDDIADQTNLLALNAAIEAARAGEQGRGFAVVADEVRKLAERTTEATKQIANMIKGIQNETQQAVIAMNKGNEEVRSGIELADKAGNSLQMILTSTREVMDMINQIAAASEEQSATSEQISKNVMSISKVTAESAHRVEDVAGTADTLAKLTEKLAELMGQFRVDDNASMGSMKQLSRRPGKQLTSGR